MTALRYDRLELLRVRRGDTTGTTVVVTIRDCSNAPLAGYGIVRQTVSFVALWEQATWFAARSTHPRGAPRQNWFVMANAARLELCTPQGYYAGKPYQKFRQLLSA